MPDTGAEATAATTKEEIQVTLSKLLSKIDLVEKKRTSNRNLNFFLSLLILSVFILFGFSLTKPFREMKLSTVLAQVSKSTLIQQTLNQSIHKASRELAPSLHSGFIQPLLQDPKLLEKMSSETNTFIQVAEQDLTANLAPLYIKLVKSQKDFLEEVFPEIKNKAAIEKAMDHLIQIGAPKIRASFIKPFNEHIQILLSIHSKVQTLKDPSLKNLPSFEKAVLGVTLELFGRLLRQAGEKTHE